MTPSLAPTGASFSPSPPSTSAEKNAGSADGQTFGEALQAAKVNAQMSHPTAPASALTAPITPGHRMPVIKREDVDPQVRKAAEGMEAMFLNYLMKTMRDTIPKSEMDLESPATKIYTGMLDTETADRAARQGGIGLADQLIAYLSAQSYTGGSGSAVSTGGTAHAGQRSNK